MVQKSLTISIMLIVLSLSVGLSDAAPAQSEFDPTTQTQTLLYDEARTVYLGNLARRENGVPPLRWNLKLTHAGRWFSWDSVENRPGGYCGHQDTLGRWPGDRALYYGYLGGAGAENAYCGYVTPEQAIQGWMNSSDHRANLLSAGSREIGLGYYRRDSDGRGYATQNFGNDPVYAPVVIENEALSTNNPFVNLYIYDRSTGGGFAGLSAATKMMVGNNSSFCGVTWEPYQANKGWTLEGGNGWRGVFVKTRDVFNRSLLVNDSIYLGANLPLNGLGDRQMATTSSQITIRNLDGGSLSQVQFSLGWLADDTFGTFTKYWGNGERVNDTTAWGGSAYRLTPGNGESFAWVYDTAFIKNTPMVAYFRLKVNDNTSVSEAARISVQGGPTEYGLLSIKGTDFTNANQYQEFAVNFTFNPTDADPFLIFKFWRSGNADLYVDAVSIFSAPQPIVLPFTWSVPGSNYRGQGVWVRYTNGSQFSAISEGDTTPSFTISGNTGVGGVNLNYSDCTSKEVNSDNNGNYSFTVPHGWSGTVTAYKKGYIFSPNSKSYSDIQSDQSAQNYTAQVCVGCADVKITISKSQSKNYTIPSQPSQIVNYPSIMAGPVKVSSTTGAGIIASQRSIAPGGINEVMGYPASQLAKEYWFTWYDWKSANVATWILVGNPSTDTDAHVDIYIAGVHYGPYTIKPGESITPSYPGLMGGPVHVVSDIKVYASERTAVYNSFHEVTGYPATQFDTEYWFPWYDWKSAGVATWVMMSNPDATRTATVDVYVAGVYRQTFTILPGQSDAYTKEGLMGGPVKVISKSVNGNPAVPIFASERSVIGNTFNEVMGYPTSQFAKTYYYPWYEHDGTNMVTWILIGNPSDTDAVEVDIYIAGQKQDHFSIPAKQSISPTFDMNTGPLEVRSTNDKVFFTSERILYKPNVLNSFNETFGIPANRLDTDYYFTWYDSITMSTDIIVAKP